MALHLSNSSRNVGMLKVKIRIPIPCPQIYRNSAAWRPHRQRGFFPRICAAASDPQFSSSDHQDKADGVFRFGKQALASLSRKNEEFAMKLKRFGIAGLLSYGLFNTCYYLGAFFFVWFYVSPSPGGLGYAAAAQRFIKLLAMVWAGSQVTKLFRAAGALALAPFVDTGLNQFTNRFKFQSREKAFGFIVASCFALAFLVFVAMTTLWA